MYKVSEAASLAGVTVRALHHYDAIGLLRPTARSGADYRLYGDRDIRALRRIRRYQALGFSLDEIQELLKASRKNRLDALRNQRDAIRRRAAETADVVRAINREITAENGSGSRPPTGSAGRRPWSASISSGLPEASRTRPCSWPRRSTCYARWQAARASTPPRSGWRPGSTGAARTGRMSPTCASVSLDRRPTGKTGRSPRSRSSRR